jgi:hypothetical protein
MFGFIRYLIPALINFIIWLGEPLLPLLMNDPEHWKLRAQEARLAARHLDDPEAKAAMIKVAEEYERVAARAAERVLKNPE